MKKIKQIAIVGLSSLLLSACSTIIPVTATNNPIGSKVGKSATTMFFGGANSLSLSSGIVTNKNYGVIEAAEKGNIERIATVDIKITNLYIFSKAEIIVTGE